MLRNYLKITLLNLMRTPALSAIKIASLALGLACSILVLLHVQYVRGFDRHIQNHERTYRLVSSFNSEQQRVDTWVSSDAYAPLLRRHYPQIEHIARLRPDNGLFSSGSETFPDFFYWAEPEVIDIFSLDFIAGNPTTALAQPNSVVLNQTTAQRLFAGADAIGQTLTLEAYSRKVDLKVSGVVRDLPANTHIDLHMLVSVETGRPLFGAGFIAGTSWQTFNRILTYLTTTTAEEGAALSKDLVNFVDANVPEDQRADVLGSELTLALEPIADVYLSSRQGIAFRQGDNNRAVILGGLAAFAGLILLTACINFANLSLAQVWQRGKEVGIRKTLGAGRGRIVSQFLIESLSLSLLAFFIALPFIELAIPLYTQLTATSFTRDDMWRVESMLRLVLFVVATGIVAGLMPAWLLSRLKPAIVIKGIPVAGRWNRLVRPLAIVFQFTVSTALIILAAAVSLQVKHLNTMNIGFDKSNLLVLDSTQSRQGPEQFDYAAMINELQQHPGITSIATSNVLPPDAGDHDTWRLPSFAPDESRAVAHYMVDANYVDTMRLQLVAGRGFQQDFPTDFIARATPASSDPTASPGIIITRSAARSFGFATPDAALDETFLFRDEQYRVIGVIEDFHLSGGMEDALNTTGILRATLEPLRVLMIRLDPMQVSSALDHIDAVWQRHRPDVPVNRRFYDQVFNDMVYVQTNGISKASLFASGITVLISAFGLYALAFYAGQRRTKEVGVRKALGATSRSVIRLLIVDFLKPVLVACILAWGLGYLAIGAFYEQFSSRAVITPLLYLAVTLGIVLLAVLTVATQSFHAANVRPVLALRWE